MSDPEDVTSQSVGRPANRHRLLLGISCLVVLATLIPGSADAALYWGGLDGIGRENVDGSVANPAFIRAGDATICGIDVDSQHLYWADSSRDKIGRANLDGTNVEENFISPAGGLPCDLAVGSDHIYWPNMGGDTIGRARLDGSHVEADFITAPEHPCGVAVNRTTIYWSSDQEGAIWATDIDGLNGPEEVVAGLSTPCGIALDQAHLYWADSDPGTVGRANLDGSEALPNFIVGGEFTSTVAINAGRLYWVNAGWGFESIGRANLDGTEVNQRFLAGLRNPYALAVDDVQVAPASEPPKEFSSLRIGKIKRNGRSGVVHVGIDLPAHGVLRAAVTGGGARLAPRVLEDGRALDAGRGWLKLTPLVRRHGRCAGGGTDRIGVTLYLSFAEFGKEPAGKSKKLWLRPMALAACKRSHVQHRRR